jgi:hypothetical protein
VWCIMWYTFWKTHARLNFTAEVESVTSNMHIMTKTVANYSVNVIGSMCAVLQTPFDSFFIRQTSFDNLNSKFIRFNSSYACMHTYIDTYTYIYTYVCVRIYIIWIYENRWLASSRERHFGIGEVHTITNTLTLKSVWEREVRGF